MPCRIQNHEHVWQTSGVLRICRCERICGFCTDGGELPLSADLRHHIRTVHSDMRSLTVASVSARYQNPNSKKRSRAEMIGDDEDDSEDDSGRPVKKDSQKSIDTTKAFEKSHNSVADDGDTKQDDIDDSEEDSDEDDHASLRVGSEPAPEYPPPVKPPHPRMHAANNFPIGPKKTTQSLQRVIAPPGPLTHQPAWGCHVPFQHQQQTNFIRPPNTQMFNPQWALGAPGMMPAALAQGPQPMGNAFQQPGVFAPVPGLGPPIFAHQAFPPINQAVPPIYQPVNPAPPAATDISQVNPNSFALSNAVRQATKHALVAGVPHNQIISVLKNAMDYAMNDRAQRFVHGQVQALSQGGDRGEQRAPH